MLDKNKLLELVHKLHRENPELTKYGGLGYCGYASKLLQLELERQGVSSQIIHGLGIRQTPRGRMIYTGVINVGRSITETSGDYFKIKNILTQSKKTIENNIGHLVVLIDNKLIVDPTSRQFLAPDIYGLNAFVDGWNSIFKVDVNVVPVEKSFFRFTTSNRVKWIEAEKYVEDSMFHDKTMTVADKAFNNLWSW